MKWVDEYIAKFNVDKSVGKRSNNNENKFKAERRQQNDNDEDDMETDDSNGIWKGPDAYTNYIDLDYMNDDFEVMFNDPDSQKTSPANKKQKSFDLREKITSTALPNSNSQQWRLMQPNVMTQRPAGMPPLVPQSSIQERPMQHRNNRGGNWVNYKNYNNNNNNNNGRRWGNQRNSNQQYGNRNGSGSNNNMFNGGRVQRNNQCNSNQELRK